MSFWNFIKHSAVAGATSVSTAPLEEKIRSSNLPDDEKAKYVGALVGAAVGGVAGYYVGERVGDHKGTYTKEEKLVSTVIGAVGGGATGYFIGAYIVKSRAAPQPGQPTT